MIVIGTYKERTDWRQRYDTNQEWRTGYGYVARYLVSGVQTEQALEKDCGDDTRGKGLTEKIIELSSAKNDNAVDLTHLWFIFMAFVYIIYAVETAFLW